ncbi:hypothetical protein [Roseibium sp.]|uniref:hypothetical protein n=1 Tax=Roseibium sp. TaxID=1936156 RepID=UPI003D11BED2
MASISTTNNVVSAAHSLLRQLGFNLRAIDRGEGRIVLVAQNDEHEIQGSSAIEILGLLTVYQARDGDFSSSGDADSERIKVWDAFDEIAGSES